MKKLLLFDIDGTLIGPCKPHGTAMRAAISKIYGINTDFRILPNGLAGMTDSQIISEVLTHYGLQDSKIREALPTCLKLSSEIFCETVTEKDIVALSGSTNLLNALSNKPCILSLVTGNIKEIAFKKMELLGYKDFFKHGGFGCESIVRADLVRIAIERAQKLANFHGQATDTWVIGDTTRDIEAAKTNGVKVLSVASGHTDIEELSLAKPDYLLATLEDTEGVIKLFFRF